MSHTTRKYSQSPSLRMTDNSHCPAVHHRGQAGGQGRVPACGAWSVERGSVNGHAGPLACDPLSISAAPAPAGRATPAGAAAASPATSSPGVGKPGGHSTVRMPKVREMQLAQAEIDLASLRNGERVPERLGVAPEDWPFSTGDRRSHARRPCRRRGCHSARVVNVRMQTRNDPGSSPPRE